MAESADTQLTHPPTLTALALHGAAIASPLSVLLFRRPEVAQHLDLLGAIVGETIIFALVLIAACQLVARLRNAMPAGALLILGAIASSAGLWLMAWTISVNLFLVGGILWAAGSAPGLVMHRLLLAVDPDPGSRFRTLSWYWVAVSVGVGWPLAIDIVTDVSYNRILWVAFGLTLASAGALFRHAIVHDEDHDPERGASLLDVPWAKRSVWASFGAGMVALAGAGPAKAILEGEWQRSPTQTAAVLAAGLFASAAIGAFGPWYHRLHRLTGSRRSDAIGIQLLAAGALTSIGALSFTYIGLIVSWSLAGGALGLAAAGIDAAAFPAVTPDLRRRLASKQVLAAAAGTGTGLVVTEILFDGLSPQWQLALLGLPLIWIGWAVRRFSDTSQDAKIADEAAAATTVPRRVLGLDGQEVPILQVDHLDAGYGSVQVLFDVNLKIEPQQVVALLGTNGAGKTTLLRAISGLEPTRSGRVLFAGLDITKTKPTWRVGMGLHQIVGGEAVVGPLTVEENLKLFGHGVAPEERTRLTAEALAVFPQLAERQKQRAETLSGGEKQMLALAKALIVRPRLLLIDEFSLGLAPKVIADLLPVVRQIAARGSAVLLVEQSVNIALSIADYAYVIEKGEIGYEGSAAELRDRPELLQSAYLEGLSQALDV